MLSIGSPEEAFLGCFQLHFEVEWSKLCLGEQMANTARTLPSDARWKRALELPQRGHGESADSLQIPALKGLFVHGLARGILVEASGFQSSGKTSICMHILAQATRIGEVCAIVDLNNSFHPHSAAASGVQLDRLLWIRCNRNAEYTMRATDLLLHAGGFGVVLLDLSEANARALNRIPLSYWYRFQRAIQHTPTILLICADSPQAKAAINSLDCKAKAFCWLGEQPFTRLCGITVNARQRKLAAIRTEPLQLLAGV